MAESTSQSRGCPGQHQRYILEEGSAENQATSGDYQLLQSPLDGKDSKTQAIAASYEAPIGLRLREGKRWDAGVAKACEILRVRPEALLSGRMQSLEEFQYDDGRKRELSRAGLVLRGAGELREHENRPTLHCVFCDAGFEVRPEDEPWGLHASFSPECPFLHLMKRRDTTEVTYWNAEPAYMRCESCKREPIKAMFLPCSHPCCLQQECLFSSLECFKCQSPIKHIVPIKLYDVRRTQGQGQLE